MLGDGLQGPKRGDLLAVLLSFLAGIIQLLLFVFGTLGQTIGSQKLFYNFELIPSATLMSLIIALCIIGTYSFFKKNPDYLTNKSNFKPFIWIRNRFFDSSQGYWGFSKQRIKKNLIFSNLALLILASAFVLSVLHKLNQKNYLFINAGNVELIQLISFMGLWVLATVILFIWISSEIEKSSQFKPEDFLPNMVKALQGQGFISLKFKADITVQSQGSNRLVVAEVQSVDKYFLVQYDGKKIMREFSKDEFDSIMKQEELRIKSLPQQPVP